MSKPMVQAPDVDVDLIDTPVEPASYPGRKATRMRPSSREIKLLYPRCDTCALEAGGKKFLSWNWQDRCTHDPYVTVVEVPVTRPVYEDVMETVTTKMKVGEREVLDEDGEPKKGAFGRVVKEDIVEEQTVTQPTGRKRVVGNETIVEYVPKPNWMQATHAGGVNKGRGVDKALRRGKIYPQMLRSPVWPNGIKRRCQFRECFSEDLKRYANGWFCDPQEAALVRISDSSETYQVDFDERSRQFQRDQIDTAMAQVSR